MNKHKMLIIFLLFSVVALQGMFSNKEKKPIVNDIKTKITCLDDVKKMKDFQHNLHRGKHEVFKEEHNKLEDRQKEDK